MVICAAARGSLSRCDDEQGHSAGYPDRRLDCKGVLGRQARQRRDLVGRQARQDDAGPLGALLGGSDLLPSVVTLDDGLPKLFASSGVGCWRCSFVTRSRSASAARCSPRRRR